MAALNAATDATRTALEVEEDNADRLPPQTGVSLLHDRGEEPVEVQVELLDGRGLAHRNSSSHQTVASHHPGILGVRHELECAQTMATDLSHDLLPKVLVIPQARGSLSRQGFTCS